MMTKKPLVALDFDGVLCDSAPENAATAWMVCQQLWPQRFPEGPIPAEALQKFCAARPCMETGYQAVIITKLLQDGVAVEELFRDFAQRLESEMAASGLTKAQLVQRFGAQRDDFLRQDPAGWMGYNSFFPGATAALQTLRSRAEVIILTTKESRFVQRLCQFAGVDFAPEQIYGLEKIRNKETTLKEFLDADEFSGVTFVEDRFLTLKRVLEVPELAAVKLALASWGYVTPQHRQEAAATPQIRILDTPEQLADLA